MYIVLTVHLDFICINQTTKIGIHEFKRIHNDDRPLYHFFPFLISLH